MQMGLGKSATRQPGQDTLALGTQGLHRQCLGGPGDFPAFASNIYPQNTCYLPVSGFAYCIFRIEFFKSNCLSTIL